MAAYHRGGWGLGGPRWYRALRLVAYAPRIALELALHYLARSQGVER